MGIDNKSDQSITRLKIKTTSPKIKDDLTQKRRRPHQKMKTTSTKNEDDLTKKRRRPHQKKRRTTKMEDD